MPSFLHHKRQAEVTKRNTLTFGLTPPCKTKLMQASFCACFVRRFARLSSLFNAQTAHNSQTFCNFAAETFQTSRLCHTKKERLRWSKTEPSTRRNPQGVHSWGGPEHTRGHLSLMTPSWEHNWHIANRAYAVTATFLLLSPLERAEACQRHYKSTQSHAAASLRPPKNALA